MNKYLIILNITVWMGLLAGGSQASPIIADLSEHDIHIDSKFSGETILMFGAKHAPGNMVLVVRGQIKITWCSAKKSNLEYGTNGKQTVFKSIPSYYMVSYTDTLLSIADRTLLDDLNIGINHLYLNMDKTLNFSDNLAFTKALYKYLDRHQLLQEYEGGNFGFVDESLFRIPISFPDRIRRGVYTAELYLFDQGMLVSSQSIPLVVNRHGLEAFIYDFAYQFPGSYGILAVAIALGCGWLASIVFKREVGYGSEVKPIAVMSRTSLLVCVNDNDHSRVALKFACVKAKKTGCSVSLLHVMEPPDYQGLAMVIDRMDSDKRQQAEKLLSDMAELAYNYAGVTPVLIMCEGVIGKETVAAANSDNNIGMLIVGTSPETPGKGKLLPWLVSQLGKDLLIPMVIVPGNLTDQQIDALT